MWASRRYSSPDTRLMSDAGVVFGLYFPIGGQRGALPEGSGEGMSRSMFSDDDLLAVVCQIGLGANSSSIRRRLSDRANLIFDAIQIETRIQRLRDEGLLRIAPSGSVRLTATGVERLQSLQRAVRAQLKLSNVESA